MDQLKDFADPRLIDGCIYCGGFQETKDHVPSKVFLDRPLPTNLPVVPACRECNNGFSRDEEYVACLLEAVAVGTTDPDRVGRSVVADILRRSPELRSLIEAAKSGSEGQVIFSVDMGRVQNILLKLARGHAAYELSAVCRGDPTELNCGPLALLSDEEREVFNGVHVARLFGEVGSRSLQRQVVTQMSLVSATGEGSTLGLVVSDWLDVQEGRYRYLTCQETNGIRVRIVIGEYLYCDVFWCSEQ